MGATIDCTGRIMGSQAPNRSCAPAVSDSVLAEEEVNAEPEAVEVNAELEQIFSMPNGYNLIKNDFYPNAYMVTTAKVCPFALCERRREYVFTMCNCCLCL